MCMREKNRIEVNGLGLLSVKDYNRYFAENKLDIVRQNELWWLRADDPLERSVRFVNDKYPGETSHVDYLDKCPGLRPVLVIESTNPLKPMEKFAFKNYYWTVISDGLALCDSVICTCRYDDVDRLLDWLRDGAIRSTIALMEY